MSASNIKSFEIKNIKHTDKSTDKVIFDDLSIDFPFDKLTVICSENKEIVNLLPKILTGNETIDSGSILLDGIEVSEKELKDSIYYASSLTTKFMPNITIKDVLEAANNANERNEKLSKERMNSFYENFQIKTLIEKKTDEFNENKISENKKNIILLLEAVLKCKQIIVFENFPLITSSKAIKFLKKYINKNKIVLISLVSDPTIFSNIESKKY
jgi:ABC-type multidrug transport system ATPase subunit